MGRNDWIENDGQRVRKKASKLDVKKRKKKLMNWWMNMAKSLIHFINYSPHTWQHYNNLRMTFFLFIPSLRHQRKRFKMFFVSFDKRRLQYSKTQCLMAIKTNQNPLFARSSKDCLRSFFLSRLLFSSCAQLFMIDIYHVGCEWCDCMYCSWEKFFLRFCISHQLSSF